MVNAIAFTIPFYSLESCSKRWIDHLGQKVEQKENYLDPITHTSYFITGYFNFIIIH